MIDFKIANLAKLIPVRKGRKLIRSLKFASKLLLTAVITLFITTALLYLTVMFTPAETRAVLYMPKNISSRVTEEQIQKMVDRIIEQYHLNDPYPVQYYYWVKQLVQGSWGYSPTMQEDVLTAISRRAPATAELTLYSLLLYIPLGLLSGVIASSKKERWQDHGFRLTAFIATSLPPFILAIILMSIFYGNLNWFAPERTSLAINSLVKSNEFHLWTGMLTIDGILNGRLEVTLDALRHLLMPAITLAFAHWATLGRIMRTTMVEEQQQDYVTAARARGIPERRILWRHNLPNAVAPAMTSTILSAASLLSGVYMVEIIFNIHGISEIAVRSWNYIPDAPAALGFAIYSVLVVILLMTALNIIQHVIDPRLGEEFK